MMEELEEAFGEFYPGSRHRREDGPVIPEPVQAVVETDWDTNPKWLTLDGVDVEFFTIGALATALNRQVVTIRKWEREGVLPVATYRSAGARKNRLYTRAQIEGLRLIAAEEGLMDPTIKKNLGDTDFSARARQLFRALQDVGFS